MFKLFRMLFYRVKYQKQVANFPKLIEVVLSCDTPDQCTTAMQYIKLYKQQAVSDNSAFDQVTLAILGQLIAFLQDTTEHTYNGYHKPEHNGYKTIRTYPDLNDYMNKLLSIKFAKTWVRGKSSVIGFNG